LLAGTSLEKLDGPLRRTIEAGLQSSASYGDHPARFSLAYQPVNIMTRDEARCADGHHLSAASPAPDLNPADLTSVQHHAVTPAPSAEGPHPASRLYSHVCSHGLLQSHWEFSVHLFIDVRFLPENRAKIYEETGALSTTIFRGQP
jgi:hypothetical protein